MAVMAQSGSRALTFAQRCKLRDYARQDQIDADWFEFMGDPVRAGEYRQCAHKLLAMANAPK